MKALVWSDRAMTRRDEIFDYIAQADPEAALKLDMAFETAANRLFDFPFTGRAGTVQGTRELVVTPNYILVYRVMDGVIEIITIHHAAMNRID